jgi:addiction module RelE/StbE family toxin
MIRIDYSHHFIKQYRKLPATDRAQFEKWLCLWQQDQTLQVLNVHKLKGGLRGFYSMNVRGDLRALYRYEGETIVLFDFIGTHSQLYG